MYATDPVHLEPYITRQDEEGIVFNLVPGTIALGTLTVKAKYGGSFGIDLIDQRADEVQYHVNLLVGFRKEQPQGDTFHQNHRPYEGCWGPEEDHVARTLEVERGDEIEVVMRTALTEAGDGTASFQTTFKSGGKAQQLPPYIWGGHQVSNLRNIDQIRIRLKGDCGKAWVESQGFVGGTSLPCKIEEEARPGTFEIFPDGIIWTPVHPSEIPYEFHDHERHRNLRSQVLPPARQRIFIGILTSPRNRELRDAQRGGWLQDPLLRGRGSHAFFIGEVADQSLEDLISAEMQEYGDIVRTKGPEGFDKITHKIIEILRYGAEVAAAEYVVKCDDDTFFHMDRLWELLATQPTQYLYSGRMFCYGQPHRDPSSNYFVTLEQFAGTHYPPFAHGPGYVVTRDVAQALSDLHSRAELKFLKLEDVSMAMWIDWLKKHHNFQIHMVSDDRFYYGECQEDAISAHKMSGQQQLCMWQQRQMGQARCCS